MRSLMPLSFSFSGSGFMGDAFPDVQIGGQDREEEEEDS